MLRVIIEFWPFGNEKEKRVLDGGLVIWNEGTGDHNKGNYGFILSSNPEEIKDRQVTKVKGHKRNEGALKLVWKCLDKIYGKGTK